MPKPQITYLIITISVLAVIIAILTDANPGIYSFINSLSIGIVVSSIFYFLVVWVPAIQKRKRIHNNLKNTFKSFKLSCISSFLIASNQQQYSPQEMLLDQEEFRRFFKVKVSNDQNRWHVVLNSLNGNVYLLNEILYEIEILREEIHFTLNNIDVHNDDVFDFLKRLSQYIYRFKTIKPEYDDIKSLSGFLWEVFSGWSFIHGYSENDLFDEMLKII